MSFSDNLLDNNGKRQYSVSFVYRSYHLPMPDQSPSTPTVNSSFLQLDRSVGRPQRAVNPMQLPVNTHYFSRPRTRYHRPTSDVN